MAKEYKFSEIVIEEVSIIDLRMELYKKKLQFSVYKDSHNVVGLEKYINKLEEEIKRVKAIQEKIEEKIKEKPAPPYKLLLIFSMVLLLIFGISAVVMSSVLFGFIAFIDILIGLFAYFNYKENRNEKRITL